MKLGAHTSGVFSPCLRNKIGLVYVHIRRYSYPRGVSSVYQEQNWISIYSHQVFISQSFFLYVSETKSDWDMLTLGVHISEVFFHVILIGTNLD